MHSTARRAVLTAAALTILLGVPLGTGFISLLREAGVEAALKAQLLANTQTFHRVELTKADFNWRTSPPEVTLFVRSSSPITPGQVAALESFVRFKTKRPFRLIFEVTPLVEVTGSALPPAP